MRRRTVLAGVGMAFGVPVGHTALAGDTLPLQPSTSNSESEERPAGREIMNSDPEKVAETIEFGTPNDDDSVRPYRFVVWNDSSSERTVRVRATTGDGSTVLDEQRAVPADKAVEFVFHEPDDYSVVVELPETGASATATVQKEQFDCNAFATNVRLKEDGTFESETVTTWLDCGSEVTMPDDL